MMAELILLILKYIMKNKFPIFWDALCSNYMYAHIQGLRHCVVGSITKELLYMYLLGIWYYMYSDNNVHVYISSVE